VGTPRGPIEAHVERGFNLAHFVVYSTGLSPGIFPGIISEDFGCAGLYKNALESLSIKYVYTCERGVFYTSPFIYSRGMCCVYSRGRCLYRYGYTMYYSNVSDSFCFYWFS